jgi:CTP:molybdopterin cytidylyltransferase MocA
VLLVSDQLQGFANLEHLRHGRVEGHLVPRLEAEHGPIRHPVGFSGKFKNQLLALQGDEGAKKLLAAHEDSLKKIPVGDPGVIRDMDTPGDLAPPLRI